MALNGDLLKRLEVHEEETFVVIVEVLVLPRFDPNRINFHTGIEGVIDHLARLQVFELGSNKCRTFSRLYMQEFNDLPQSVVVIQHEAVLDVRGRRHEVDSLG